MKTHCQILTSCSGTLHSFRCAYVLCLDCSAAPVALPLLCWPPQARPHATTRSLLQVVAAQLFQHPFIPGNRGWQKELTPSFHIKKKSMGGDYLVLAPLTLRFCTTAHGHPRALSRQGEGERTARTGLEELTPETSHHVCRVRNARLPVPALLRTAHQRDTSETPLGRAPFNCTVPGSRAYSSHFWCAHIQRFLSKNLLVFTCYQTSYFNATY